MLVAEQTAAGKLTRESGTLPGYWPGIYGCEYKNLSSIYVHSATARLALLQGDLTQAEVHNVALLLLHAWYLTESMLHICMMRSSLAEADIKLLS